MYIQNTLCPLFQLLLNNPILPSNHSSYWKLKKVTSETKGVKSLKQCTSMSMGVAWVEARSTADSSLQHGIVSQWQLILEWREHSYLQHRRFIFDSANISLMPVKLFRLYLPSFDSKQRALLDSSIPTPWNMDWHWYPERNILLSGEWAFSWEKNVDNIPREGHHFILAASLTRMCSWNICKFPEAFASFLVQVFELWLSF